MSAAGNPSAAEAQFAEDPRKITTGCDLDLRSLGQGIRQASEIAPILASVDDYDDSAISLAANQPADHLFQMKQHASE